MVDLELTAPAAAAGRAPCLRRDSRVAEPTASVTKISGATPAEVAAPVAAAVPVSAPAAAALAVAAVAAPLAQAAPGVDGVWEAAG